MGYLLILSALSLLAQGTDDSQARPPVTKADVQIVKRAREILDSPAKWNRADTRVCPADAKTFSLYCALEKATDEVSGNFEHRGAAMQEARFAIDDIAPNRDYDHRLMGYNNDPTTTFADIQKVFGLLEARIEKRLTEVPATTQAPVRDSKTELRVLNRVREILDSPVKWNRTDTQDCPAEAKTFSLYCAFQMAEIEVTGANSGGAAIQEARRAIGETAPNRSKYNARLTDFNNDPATTFADIQNLFKAVEEQLVKLSQR